jgi:hypothetical protein
MKIAVSLEDDVIQIVKDFAASRNLDFDAALSVLVRKGIESPRAISPLVGTAQIGEGRLFLGKKPRRAWLPCMHWR